MPDHDTQTTETRPEGDLDPGARHDGEHPEPLGPLTPDGETAVGDSPDVHDTISPHDLPKGHPARAEAERRAAANGDG